MLPSLIVGRRVGRHDGPDFSWLGPELPLSVDDLCFSFTRDFQGCCLEPRALQRRTAYCICESLFLIHL